MITYSSKRVLVRLRSWWRSSDNAWLIKLYWYFLKNPSFYIQFREAKRLKAQGLELKPM